MKLFISIFAMSVAMFFGSGCASFHPQSAKNKLPTACLATCKSLDITPTKYIFTVNIAAQRASLFEDGQFVKTVECSTSRFGIGEQLNSFCTPRGLHRIAEKAGDGYQAGTIFSERKAVGSVENLGVSSAGITTRILWLEGSIAVPTASSTWTRTTARFTSTASATRTRSVNPHPTVASTSPTRT